MFLVQRVLQVLQESLRQDKQVLQVRVEPTQRMALRVSRVLEVKPERLDRQEQPDLLDLRGPDLRELQEQLDPPVLMYLPGLQVL